MKLTKQQAGYGVDFNGGGRVGGGLGGWHSPTGISGAPQALGHGPDGEGDPCGLNQRAGDQLGRGKGKLENAPFK